MLHTPQSGSRQNEGICCATSFFFLVPLANARFSRAEMVERAVPGAPLAHAVVDRLQSSMPILLVPCLFCG